MRELCDSLAAGILKICEANNTKIACAESLTGGLLADAFVRIPGASNVLLGSAVTYDINAKASILHVDKALLDREGAVHPEVVRQMAVATAYTASRNTATESSAFPPPAWPAPVRTVTSRPDWCMWACASPQASPRTMPKCSKPSNSILMACAKRFVASPYSTFCKT